jgi:hypothetical protein
VEFRLETRKRGLSIFLPGNLKAKTRHRKNIIRLILFMLNMKLKEAVVDRGLLVHSEQQARNTNCLSN